ncbi:putative phosphatase regulatory subunit-domain-containing protein [Auriculariales sp. MPI-PUGE-AT-0066]|nr:putative phosphatase regulatory subunit-domain-containing protein [Auriculariales sp. MPI-PUGE-AT-0066]
MSLHSFKKSANTRRRRPLQNVHFPTRNEELQSVRLYRPAGRPAAVSLGAEETETETEGYESSGYPFPVTPPSQQQQDSIITLNTGLTSPVPTPSATHASGSAVSTNVHLETMQLPKTRPYTLVGSVLVRNVAFHKSVAIRFTMDDWQTTSEVTAHYVSSLPSLPPPFHESRSSPLGGNAIASRSHAGAGWDRFGWQIKLEDVTERRLAEKTMYLVVRYSAQGDGGGEWWDNNAGANYRVMFRKETVVTTIKPTAGPLGPGTSPTTRQLAHQIRAENRSGGLPPLQLRAKRPSLSTSLSFGNAPRSVGGAGRPAATVDFGQPAHHEAHANGHAHHGGHGHHAHAHAASTSHKPMLHSPVSPKGLSLKNYCPPSSPKSPPPPASVTALPPSTVNITQQPSPPRSPVRTSGPTLELTTREIVLDGGMPMSVPVPIGASGASFPLLSTSSDASTPKASTNGRSPPSLVLPARSQVDFSRGFASGNQDNSPGTVNTVLPPMSPIGSPGTNASYEALVKQWCFGGSSNVVGAQAGGFADQSQHAAAGFMGHGFMPKSARGCR